MGGQRHPDGVATYPANVEQLRAFDAASTQLAEFRVPVLLRSESSDRLFVAALDGTGNSQRRDLPENHTNVALIYQQVFRASREARDDIAAGYVEGVGTQAGLV